MAEDTSTRNYSVDRVVSSLYSSLRKCLDSIGRPRQWKSRLSVTARIASPCYREIGLDGRLVSQNDASQSGIVALCLTISD